MEDIRSYIGGSALAVDTNEGLRGKSISAFKVGLEAIEKTPLEDLVTAPMNLLRPELLAELRRATDEECGMTVVDNADDHKFFTCLRRKDIRNKEFDYSTVDIPRLISDLMQLRHEMTIQLSNLKNLRKDSEDEAKKTVVEKEAETMIRFSLFDHTVDTVTKRKNNHYFDAQSPSIIQEIRHKMVQMYFRNKSI